MSLVRSELGQRRQGYMGHLTRIANQLVHSSTGDGVGDSPSTGNALVLGSTHCTLCFKMNMHLCSVPQTFHALICHWGTL